jgi:hypothetical protein
MSAIQRIEISISKSKLSLLLFFSIVFVAIGIMMFFIEPSGRRSMLNIPAIRYTVAIASIVFFGFAMFSIIKKLQENKPGLIIDKTGITDCSSSIAVGHIPWSDIQKFTVASVMNQKFLMIVVKNPNDYINRQANNLKRKGLIYNQTNYGSPVSISANTLKIKLDKLKNLLEENLAVSNSA